MILLLLFSFSLYAGEKPILEIQTYNEQIPPMFERGTLEQLEEYYGGDSDDDSGTIIGNGGDITRCEEQILFSDYYLSFISHQVSGIPYYNYSLINIERLIQKLSSVDRPIAASLESFRKSFLLRLNNHSPQVPDDVRDELSGLAAMLWSLDCPLEQAVKRVRYKNSIIYEFNYDLISKLDQNNLSWLIVHEWLWNFLDNSKDIFVMNEALQLMVLGIWDEMTIKAFVNHLYSKL
ncbi:MAG: hypothetical protein CME70_17045 [Halobacteriovorax sp.]|nr:hypothetical protein [Halobacteriovorax sp.]